MPHDLMGRIVKAPLMGKGSYGLVINVADKSDETIRKELKEVQSVYRHYASGTDLQLLKWLSSYYITPMGIALKSCFFGEIAPMVQGLEKPLPERARRAGAFIRGNESVNGLAQVCESVEGRDYKTFLLHAATAHHEHEALLDVLGAVGTAVRGIIILVPEIRHIAALELPLGRMFGDRLCLLHSKLGKGKRAEAFRRLISGDADVVIGTRSAVLAPLGEISLIAVTGEHSASYKGEEGLRYNARDVAVMRGFIEKGCVLLSSVCPSLESVYNVSAGKYARVSAGAHGPAPQGLPRIRIVGRSGRGNTDLYIMEELLKEAKKVLSKNGRLLFLINRKGYSLIRCDDCGAIVRCTKCTISLVFHKGEGMVRCHYCGYEGHVPDACAECKGVRMKAFGAGAERIKEEVEEALKTESLLVEKPKGSSRTASALPAGLSPLIIGTAYAARSMREETFSAAAFLNIDLLLAQPDFRAYERALQEIMETAQLVGPGGAVFLQTYHQKDRLLRCIRDYDFEGFYDYELSQRKALGYPPFSKIILLNIFAKRLSDALVHEISAAVEDIGGAGAGILGPLEIPSHAKAYKYCIQVLVRSKSSKVANAAAVHMLEKLKKNRGINIHIDVDPLKL